MLAIHNLKKLFVHFLAVLFGIGPYLVFAGILAEHPLLVKTAPEGWRFPSSNALMFLLANIGPFLYTLYQKYSKRKIKEVYLIYVSQLLETFVALFAIFVIEKTMRFGGEEHSVPVFVMSFLSALIGWTSSVLYLPYMGRFKEAYIKSFVLGDALSGFFPSVVAAIQGVGGDDNGDSGEQCNKISHSDSGYQQEPLFGTDIFFTFILVMIVICTLSFYLLENLSICKTEYAEMDASTDGYDYVYRNSKNDMSLANESPLSSKKYALLLFISFLNSFFAIGILPSLVPFAVLPFGNNIYLIVTTLVLSISPAACIISMFLENKSTRVVYTLTAVCLALSTITIAIAFYSPNPPMLGTQFGKIFAMLRDPFRAGLQYYIRICIVTMMRTRGGKALMFYGASMQGGAVVGSILGYVLVNFTNLLQSHNTC